MVKLFALASLVAAVAVVVAAGGGVAKADNNAAVHIDFAGCVVFDGNGGLVFETNGGEVITHGGQDIEKCSITGVPNDTGMAVNYDTNNNPVFVGLECGTDSGSTTNWHETVSAAGNATLTCHLSG
jgi:hypothetical protein